LIEEEISMAIGDQKGCVEKVDGQHGGVSNGGKLLRIGEDLL
jgi:hypothetical protein